MLINLARSFDSRLLRLQHIAVMALNRRAAGACAGLLSVVYVLTIAVIVNPQDFDRVALTCLFVLPLNCILIPKLWVPVVGWIVMWWAYFRYGPETEFAVYNHHEHKAEFGNIRGLKGFRSAVAAVARKLGEA